MRRIGGILLLVLLAACDPEPGETTVAAVSTTVEAPTSTSTSTSTSTTSTSTTTTSSTSTSTTSTTVARVSTTVPITVATTAPVARLLPATTTTVAAGSGACDPNYAGACVPIDSDVDCGGGSGNGPSYVYAKRFQVIGRDIYGLDTDNDGIACES